MMRIQSARVLDAASGRDEIADIVLRDQHIVAIEPSGSKPAAGDMVIDAEGLAACVGFIDLYARLREPGLTRKATLASECKAALAAGITTVLCAPDTDPAIDSTATVELIRQRSSSANGARVFPIAALTRGLQGAHLSELATLYAAGCVAAGQADQPIDSVSVLLRSMEYAASFDIPLILTPRDPLLAVGGCAHAGALATRLGLPSIPVVAETVALAGIIELCRDVRCRLHLSRLSSARAVDMVRRARDAGLPITADVGIHHLFFTDQQLAGFDVNFHSAVPFRSDGDRQALREGLRDGSIDAICSDHAPHDADAKLAPFPSSEPGLSSFDVFLPLLLSLPDLLDMPLLEVLAKVTSEPAKLIKSGDSSIKLASPVQNAATRLAESETADLVLIDLHADVNLTEATLLSAGKNSPLLGMTDLLHCTGEPIALQGEVKLALVGGETRFSR